MAYCHELFCNIKACRGDKATSIYRITIIAYEPCRTDDDESSKNSRRPIESIEFFDYDDDPKLVFSSETETCWQIHGVYSITRVVRAPRPSIVITVKYILFKSLLRPVRCGIVATVRRTWIGHKMANGCLFIYLLIIIIIFFSSHRSTTRAQGGFFTIHVHNKASRWLGYLRRRGTIRAKFHT